MPECLKDANVESKSWEECVKTEFYQKCVNKLQEEQLKSQFTFEDTYSQIQDVIQHMNIKNFEKGYSLNITEKTFD